ncbi:MFS transporter [Paracoccus endophyticus]|uniref:MFS transporter n=1 Tax=Paracoccus endophyticus TaxID=2233774 RepID=UPI000DD82F1B|nr:MFS transporter [Paracoccus endophyticus]
MLSVLRTTWPLLLGVLLLMVGNGMQGTLLGVRGGIEGIATADMAWVMAGYFGGFLLGSILVPGMIQRVGHVRVFAALGSMISAVLILYAALPFWQAWAVLRLVIGFSFSGVYITAESWVNASASNETRGRAMSAYMIVQMLGLVSGQVLVNFGDPAGFLPFVVPSVLVSLAFTPILLSPQPAPNFESLRPMSVVRLFRVSPLGCVGMFLIGGVFAGVYGMAPVWGSAAGLTVREVSAFVAAIFVGGLAIQYPIGWLSDRVDRRVVITGLSVSGALVVAAVIALDPGIWGLLLAAALVGGVANPVYALLIAYTNDFLPPTEMAGASAGLLFVNGIGSVAGPFVTAGLMALMGNSGFWAYNGVLLAALAVYAGWRMTRRAAPAVEAQGSFAVLSPTASPVAIEVVMADADNSPDNMAKPAGAAAV